MKIIVLFGIAACLLAACAIWMTKSPTPRPSPAQIPPDTSESVAPEIAAHIIPDPRFTPGAIDLRVTQDNIDTMICVPGFTKTIRPPARYTGGLKREQLADSARGYADQNPRDYEEDHQVPLEAGGNPTDPRNLWPEPLHGPWNAHTKDKLENLVHAMICAHEITLAEGQAAFLGNWIDAHRKYGEHR